MTKKPDKRTPPVTTIGALLLLVTTLILGACNQPTTSSPDTKAMKFNMLKVPLYGQQTSMWCWAASTQMIVGYFGKEVQQCQLANMLFRHQLHGATCCDTNLGSQGCPPPKDATCVNGGPLLVDSFGLSSDVTKTPLSWEAICQQIDSFKRPIGYGIHAPANDTVAGITASGGHLRVIVGYFTLNNHRYLIIHDPEPVCQGSVYPITYHEYLYGYSNRLVVTTTYNIRLK